MGQGGCVFECRCGSACGLEFWVWVCMC
jgi:hypothetical protein